MVSGGNDDGELYQIGVVAEQVGLSLRTIRFYEEAGVVTPSARTTGGFRLYTEDDVERLRQVKAFKPLGFSVDEMREIMDLWNRVVAGHAVPEAERRLLADYFDRAETAHDERVDQLSEARAVLRALRAAAGMTHTESAARP
jgi:DNA-binding transcriptional MerR regulator